MVDSVSSLSDIPERREPAQGETAATLPPLRIGEKALFASGDVVEGIVANALGTFLLFYLTAVCGLSGSLAGLALLFAAKEQKIKAVVPFHPGPTTAEEVAGLKAPVQLHHGTADRAVSHAKTLELEKFLRTQSTPVEVFLYDKLDHGFLAYTRPFYDADAAKLAWMRTVEFLAKELKK